MIIKDLGEGNRVIFQVDDAIDEIGDKIRVQAPDSLHSYFSFDLTIPDVDDPLPTEQLNCSLTNLLESTPPSRTYSNGVNTFRLVPANPNFVLEFATERQGITKAGAAIVGIAYYRPSKNADGSYSIQVNATGNAETILIRQVGCTSTTINPSTNDFNGGRFHAYQTDDADGIITPPVGQEGKVNVPIGAIMWEGWYTDYGTNPRNGISGQPYDRGINQTASCRVTLTEFSNLNLVPFYGEQGLTPEAIPVETSVVWNPSTGQNDIGITYKNVTCRFNKNQIACDKEIGFLKDGGIDYMAFDWYSPFDSPMGEGLHMFRQSNNKQGMKMAYINGPIGWNIPENVDYITDTMMEDYYQKINGKPLIFVDNAWIAQKFNDTIDGQPRQRTIIQYIIDEYASKSGGGQLYIVDFIIGRDYPLTGVGECSSVYLTFATDNVFPRPHSSVMSEEKRLREYFINNSTKDIIPTLTTGVYDCHRRSSLGDLGINQYTEKATPQELATKITDFIAFHNSYPNRVKSLLWYAGTEFGESGNPLVPTLAAGYNSVNVASLNVNGQNAGVNRDTLDVVKQYCKK